MRPVIRKYSINESKYLDFCSKVLIRDLLEKAQAEGYDQAVLSTWQSNSTGLALYQALGFLPVPSFKSHPNSELIFLGRTLRATDAQTSP